jgi:uncharacterized coiled-coil DUF342 family protein
MPEGTRAHKEVLLKAQSDVPAVLKRRARATRRAERAEELRRQRDGCNADVQRLREVRG